MNPEIKKLVEAPLADPLKINIPGGRDALPPRPRQPKEQRYPAPGDLTPKQVRERKALDEQAKREKLYDYYATTDLPAERVAEHVGVYRLEEDGTDDAGKVKYKRVLDVAKVEAALAWRRNK